MYKIVSYFEILPLYLANGVSYVFQLFFLGKRMGGQMEQRTLGHQGEHLRETLTRSPGLLSGLRHIHGTESTVTSGIEDGASGHPSDQQLRQTLTRSPGLFGGLRHLRDTKTALISGMEEPTLRHLTETQPTQTQSSSPDTFKIFRYLQEQRATNHPTNGDGTHQPTLNLWDHIEARCREQGSTSVAQRGNLTMSFPNDPSASIPPDPRHAASNRPAEGHPMGRDRPASGLWLNTDHPDSGRWPDVSYDAPRSRKETSPGLQVDVTETVKKAYASRAQTNMAASKKAEPRAAK